MKLITRDTDYGLRALCAIAAKGGEVVSVSQLLQEVRVSRPFLRKILQTLQKEAVLRSYKGKGGGFSLARPAAKIMLLDLMKIFQGPLLLNECTMNRKKCPELLRCPLRRKIAAIEKEFFLKLRGVTVASLLRQKG